MATREPRAQRLRRHLHIRHRVTGTPERPRLAVFRSLNHIYAQVIDDVEGKTLASSSSLDREIRDHRKGRSKGDISTSVGQLIANRAKEQGIQKVAFDRGGFKYHGRIKALADSARSEGLVF